MSKGYNLINRFSEDIDLAIDRAFFDMSGELSRSKIKRLRQVSSKFISEEFSVHLKEKINQVGLPITCIKVEPYDTSDTDPLRISITYDPLTEKNEYVTPRVLLEISCRSLREPCEELAVQSLVDQEYPDAEFTNPKFQVRTVKPERTFLEKVFLLHEEWQKDNIRITRLSRHLYDLERLMDTQFAKIALKDKDLYFHIVNHRSKFTVVSGIDYNNHRPKFITIVPPEDVLKQYQEDYNEMKESMFVGETLIWEDFIQRLTVLQSRIRELNW